VKTLPWIDLAVILVYLIGVVGYGIWFYWRNRESEQFMSAGRSLPGWAIGLSIFGSYVSSISFLANPGKSYAGDWSAFVFALTLPIAAFIAVRYFVPFYRRSGEVSAYHHLEKRFGPWARTYAVACYMMTQVARLGTILYLLGLALGEKPVGIEQRRILPQRHVAVNRPGRNHEHGSPRHPSPR
jgi:SSS family solute:Na+ symporter